ncbi:gamma-glutamyl phosphate reductase-like protein [Novymonas esmeraldas]|uniref:Gamma-glutamyl phosphate reductase-like protein n=1 Tax=Novymonas esmeraldas TaxID=1808958 RepID=A0AAW0EYC1_9TRYP
MMLRLTNCCRLAPNIAHELHAAAEARAVVAASPFAQRRAFIAALSDELHRHADHIARANLRDCDVFGQQQQQQQQQRGASSTIVAPTHPGLGTSTSSAAAVARHDGHTCHARHHVSSAAAAAVTAPRRQRSLAYVAAAAVSTPTAAGDRGGAGGTTNTPAGHAGAATAPPLASATWGVLGGHDHHRRVSPLRLDKLHSTLDFLLRQPDPIALPRGCWLRDDADADAAAAAGDVVDDPGASRGRCTRRTADLEVFELPVPLGTVGVLSRFRPRISIDAVAMALLAGNAVLVDGGVSLHHTNIALTASVRRALIAVGLPPTAVVCVESFDAAHRSTLDWLQLSDHVDLAVVCGPPKLFDFATRHTTIPLLRATGRFSSVYVDQSASFAVALDVVINSKFQRLGAANAATSVIIHSQFPRYTELLLALAAEGAVLLGDAAAQERAPDCVAELASEEAYGGLPHHGLRDAARTLCVKTVDTLAQALFFIDSFGAAQSDAIVATDEAVCAAYCRRVDSAVVLVNASTRLSSGVPLGCGVDFAISTSKVHRRGPLTLEMMTTRKWVARGRDPTRGARR